MLRYEQLILRLKLMLYTTHLKMGRVISRSTYQKGACHRKQMCYV